MATDVFPDEPKGGEAAFHSELGKLPHVYGTHHIGASTEQAQDAIARETVRSWISSSTRAWCPTA